MSSFVRAAKGLVIDAVHRTGYHTEIPTIVFESDDWGSVRTPSAEAIADFQRLYPEHKLNHYQLFDGLDTSEDLKALAVALRNHSNDDGKHPRFTMNYAMANPIFDDENYKLGSAFRFEPMWETYAREQGNDHSSLSLILQGTYSDVFQPQLHSREHLNVTSWRKGIKRDPMLRQAYEMGLIGLDPGPYSSLDALNRDNTEISREEFLSEAFQMFKDCFGYASYSYIPPCYVIGRDDERILSGLDVRVLQSGAKVNRQLPNGKLIGIPTPLGGKTAYDQVRLVRNVQFEPTRWLFAGMDAETIINDALTEIQKVVSNKQPAIVCTHRVNYVGGISAENRERSIDCLGQLLERVLKRYPNIRFMTSDELGSLIFRG